MPQPKVARRRAAAVVDSEHGRQGELMSSSQACDGSRAGHDGVVDATLRAIRAAHRAPRFRGGSIGCAADRRLADERRQSLQPALFVAESNQHLERRRAQRRVARAFARLGRRTEVLWSSAAVGARRRRVREHRSERRVRVVDRYGRDSLAVRPPIFPRSCRAVCCGWTNRGVALSEDKVFMAGSMASSSRSIAGPGTPPGRSTLSDRRRTFRSLPAPVYFDGHGDHGASPARIAALADGSRRTTRTTAGSSGRST